jgi:hypothetical protein
MTPEHRAALRLVAGALPAGTSIPVLREHLLALLDGEVKALPTPALAEDLTCADVGRIIGRHSSTVRAMCERRELPGAYRQHGREWRIPAGAVETYRRSQAAPLAPRISRAPAELGAWRRHLPSKSA